MACNKAFHRCHQYNYEYDYAVGTVEIPIVLASVSLTACIRSLLLGATLIGAAAIAGSTGIAQNLLDFRISRQAPVSHPWSTAHETDFHPNRKQSC
jgi:hypothetical protein